MTKVTFLVAHPPARILGTDSAELAFRNPSTGHTVYCTSTATTGVFRRTTHKRLYRGPRAADDDPACVRVATVDAPGSGGAGAVELAPEALAAADEDGKGKEEEAVTLKLKKPWFGGGNRTVEFRGMTYTWQGMSRVTDGEGRVVARMKEPWFFQGKVGDLEVDVGDDEGGGKEEEKDREVLEMVLATYVSRWWEEKVKEEEAKKEEKELKDREAKAKKEKEKKEKEREKAEEAQKGEAA